MKAPTTHGAGPVKTDILSDVIAQVLAMGATRFKLNQDYGQAEVWAVKGPLELSIASFKSDSAKAIELGRRLHELKANQMSIVVNGNECLLVVETSDSGRERTFRVTIRPNKR
jgi:hypothetical protein